MAGSQVERLTLEATHVGDPAVAAAPGGGGGAPPDASLTASPAAWKPSAVALWMPPATKPTKAPSPSYLPEKAPPLPSELQASSEVQGSLVWRSDGHQLIEVKQVLVASISSKL